MAINPIHLLTASTAKATNGSSTIEVFGSIDTSRLFQGSVVTLGTFAAVEAISGTPVDSSGNSTITLFQPWPEATTTARLSAFNSIEGLTGAIEKSRQVVANTSAIEDLSGTGFLERTGPTTYALNTVTTQAKSFLNDSTASEQRDTLKLGDAEVFPNPLDFGLGISGNTIASLPKTSLDDLTIAGGVFRVINTNTGTRPEGFSQFGVVAVWRYDSKLISQIYIDANGKKASRVIKDTGVGDWDIEFNSGNSVNPLDFGIGPYRSNATSDLKGVNIDSFASGGLFTGFDGGNDNASTGDNPFPISGGAYSLINMNGVTTSGASYKSQLAMRMNNKSAGVNIRARSVANEEYTDWVDVFHSGNTINPLDYGLKDAVALASDDNLDDIVKSGFYYNVTGGNTSGNNYPIVSAGTLLVISKGINNSVQSQTFTRFGENQADTSWTRTYGGSWSPWRLNYDSGNTNFNEWPVTAGRALTINAIAINNNTVVVELPIVSKELPTGFSNAGSFQIIRVAGGQTVATGIQPTLGSASTSRTAPALFADNGSFVSGEHYRVISESDSTKITVNF
jgi:hypothetical protein